MSANKCASLLLFCLLALGLIAPGCQRQETPPKFDLSQTNQVFERLYLDLSPQGLEAPPFQVTGLKGQVVSLEQYRGRLLFLNFWATWCPPCKAEMPDMEELFQLLGGENFSILAISQGESASSVQAFLKQYPYSFDLALDPNREAGALYHVEGLPTSYLIGKDGKILAKSIGPRRWKDPQFIALLRAYANLPTPKP